MRKRKLLRMAALAMFIIAVLFVLCALSAPNLGRTIYIGSFAFGVEQWRACYALYAAVMAALFAASFFVKDRKKQ